MNENDQVSLRQTAQYGQLQAWAMSLICGLLGLFAISAATRLPHYLNTSDYMRLIGVILFGLLVLAGLVENIRFHLCLRQLLKEEYK